MKYKSFADIYAKRHPAQLWLDALINTITFVILFSMFSQTDSYFSTSRIFKNLNKNNILYVSKSFSRYREVQIETDEWYEQYETLRNELSERYPDKSVFEIIEMVYDKIGTEPESAVSLDEVENTPFLEEIWLCGSVGVQTYDSDILCAERKLC
ncbi:MAG: hypothetical protein LUE12_06555 [Ruminococcus sp.]|nr:hypothetical protein [Ruminococcus sp.]